MGFFNSLSKLIASASKLIPEENRETASIAQLREKQIKEKLDRLDKMQLLIKEESDPLIRQKLKNRIDNNIFVWEDLYC